MASSNPSSEDPVKVAVLRQIRLNHAPLGRTSLSEVFGYDEDTSEDIEAALAELLKTGDIILETRGYRATKPWADIAYAVVGTIDGRKRAPVTILNMPEETDLNITLSQADIIKHRLQEGSRIVVRLDRDANDPMGLRARFLALAETPFQLVGIFNQKARNFTPLDRSIKTEFQLAQIPEKDTVPHQFLIELPMNFDMRTPSASIVHDQTRDMSTGTAISWIITRKHDIAHAHPEDVLKEAQRINRRKPNQDHRVDLRELDFVTVDPLGSTDLDDAFCAQIEGDGYALYTAITDVPSMVPYGSRVDREAYRRGSTFYLTGSHTAHMLPPILSTRKCSLLPNMDRPAIVVKQLLDWQGHLLDSSVFAATIRSKEQLSYGQFYDFLERGDPRFKAISAIHDARRRNGLNAELDSLLRESPERFASKSIIETLMVQTNSLIPKFLSAAGIPFLSRNFEVQNPNDPVKNAPLQRAYYATCAAGHAQLGLRHYAHVTSPVRRYADNVNIRALHRALGNDALGITDEEISQLDEIATHLNNRRRLERDVAHDLDKYHAIRDLTRVQAAPVRAFINEIGADYVEVTVIHTGLRQRLMASSLPANQWQIDGQKRELVLFDGNGQEVRRYRQTEMLLGQVYDVNPAKAQWQIKLVPTDPQSRIILPPSAKPF